MSLTAALRARLSTRPDSEHEQALLRIVIISLVTVFIWGRVPSSAEDLAGDKLLVGSVGSFLLAIGIFVAICLWPGPNAARRVLGMLILFLAGESGVGLVGVYLFIIFSNGFRYGRSYLFLCQALCVAGFMAVMIAAPWWREHFSIGYGLMCSMIVVLYVAMLLKHILKAHAKTEQALKEWREQRESRIISA